MTQADLFSHAQAQPYRGEAPYVKGSATSMEAAQSMTPHLGRLQQLVFDHLQSCGASGATQFEMGRALGLEGNTLRPRIRELEIKQLIEKTDAARLTDKRRKAVVYRARA